MKKILNAEEIMQILTQVAENQAKDRMALAELRQFQAESDARFEKQMAKDKALFKQQQAEYEAKREKEKAEYEAKREKEREEDRKALEELKQLQAKTDAQLAKTDAQMIKSDKKLEEVAAMLGNLGILQGDIAEDLFYRNIDNLFFGRNKHFNSVIRKLKKKDENNVTKGEFDIVAVNNTEVLVVEVKNKLTYKMVDEFVENKLPQFKIFFPQYDNYDVIAGMGALVIYSEVEKYAEKKGLYVITQTSDGGASIANKPNFKEKVFC